MINCRLNWYTENQHIIHPAQAGFRHNRSTEQQAVIKDNLDKGYNTTVVYVDFEKAYDSVWKSNLLIKLSKNGVSGKMLQWLKNFLIVKSESKTPHQNSNNFKLDCLREQ